MQKAGSASRAWAICGHHLGSGMVDVRHPKVCPTCLAEKLVIPVEWELTLFTVCPRHWAPLVNSCTTCGSKITWGRPHVGRCKICSSAFHSPPGSASEHEAQLAEMIAKKLHSDNGRLGFDPEPDALTRLSLNGLLSMSVFIGGITSDIKRVDSAHVARLPLPKRCELMKAASVAVNDDWPRGLHKVFSQFISNKPLDCRTGEELFPGLYEAVIRRRRREGFQHVVAEMGVYLAQSHPSAYARWNGQAEFMIASRESFALEPVSVFCARMSISHRRFIELATDLGLPHAACTKGVNARQRLNKDEVDRLENLILRQRQLTRSLVDRDSAGALFKCNKREMGLGSFREGCGFPCRDLEALADISLPIGLVAERLNVGDAVAAQILERFGVLAAKSGTNRIRSRRRLGASSYLEFERNLAKHVRFSPSTKPPGSMISIGEAVRNKLRRFDITIGAILGLILNGELEVAGYDENCRGIDRLLITMADTDEIATTAKQSRMAGHLTGEAAAKLLYLPRVTAIYSLRNAGYISGDQTGPKSGGTVLFDRSSVAEFHKRYVTISELTRLGGCGRASRHQGTIRKLLRAAGIAPTFRITANGKPVPFYDRHTCMAALASD